MLQIEVVFCPAEGEALVRSLHLPPGATAADALREAGLLQRLRTEPLTIGIWGRACAADQPLADGDRVELYRPLLIDPMEARRTRERRQAAGRTKPKAGTGR